MDVPAWAVGSADGAGVAAVVALGGGGSVSVGAAGRGATVAGIWEGGSGVTVAGIWEGGSGLAIRADCTGVGGDWAWPGKAGGSPAQAASSIATRVTAYRRI